MRKKHKIYLNCIIIFTVFFYFPVFSSFGIDRDNTLQQPIRHADGTIRIQGRIIDESGEPIVGATIRSDDLSTGTISNEEGNYYLLLKNKPGAILFSYLGYKDQQIKYDGQSVINITMEEDSRLLNEVVVTGYQTISKERATGSYAIVNNKKLEEKITFNATSALEGQVAGVSTFGDQITIRGISTISSGVGTSPLIVVDGMPTNRSINDINMNDVESITVLKDAASTSIYGVRAANGVIVVTTKKGTKGKTVINFSTDMQWTQNPSLDQFHIASTADYLKWEQANLNYLAAKEKKSVFQYLTDYRHDVGSSSAIYYSPLYNLNYDYLSGTISENQFNQTINGWKNNNYNQEYMDEMWRTPFKQSYNLSLSNASDRQNTYISFNYTGNDYQMKSKDDQLLRSYLKTDLNITSWLSLNLAIDFQYGKTNNSLTEGDFEFGTTIAGRIEPYQQLIDDNGNRVQKPYYQIAMNPKMASSLDQISAYSPYSFNPLDEIGLYSVTNKKLSVRNIVGFNIDIWKGISFAPSFSYETGNKYDDTFWDANSFKMRMKRNQFISSSTENVFVKNIPDGGYLNQTTSSYENYTFRGQLNYRSEFSKIHSVNVAAGFEMRENHTPEGTYTKYYGYSPKTLSVSTLDNFTLSNIGIKSYLTNSQAYLDLNNPQLSDVLHRYVSVYATGGYSFKDTYNFGASFRIDQADLFGTDPKYRYRPLWSVSGSWNINKEHFMEDVDWLDLLSLKASYGLTGNVDQNSSPYVLANVKVNNTYGDPVEYSQLSGAPNPTLRWERVDNYNVGVDFNIKKGLLSGSVEAYYKYSTDLLTKRSLPYAAGFPEATINNGEMSNQGIDLALNSIWLKSGDWQLTSRVVMNYNKNKIEKADYVVPNASSLMGNIGDYYQEGYPRNSVYAYHYAGLTSGGNDYQNGAPIILQQDGTPFYTIDETGKLTYVSASSVPVTEACYMGSKDPVYSGSFTQEVKFKNWQLSAMLVFYTGGKIRSPEYTGNNLTGGTGSANFGLGGGPLPDIINETWTPENTDAKYPKTSIYYAPTTILAYIGDYWKYSSFHVASGDMVRLRNVTLSYSVPEKYCKIVKLSRTRFSLQANNLWYWSKAGNDLDPEAMRYNLSPDKRVLPTQPAFLLRVELTY